MESDHKPLEQTQHKNLADTLLCLKCMPLCLQEYDINTHCHDKEMLLSALDVMIQKTRISLAYKIVFQEAVQTNAEIHEMVQTITDGCWNEISDIPQPISEVSEPQGHHHCKSWIHSMW